MNYITAAHTIDGYKVSHKEQYPAGTTQVYSNFTARNSKYFKQDTFDGNVVNFGMQYLVTYLHQLWADTFFSVPKTIAIKGIRDRLSAYSGHTDISHFEKLHDIGYLPITVKALPEGTLVPLQTPMLTITNTHPDYFWLPNYLETFISCELWHIIASATVSRQYLKVLTKWSDLTCDNAEHLPWQAHDFSMRGHTSIHSAAKSGAAHLLSFMGTDTIPSVDFLEHYYRDFTGHSIPASEHSTMTAQIQSRIPELDIRDAETATFKDLLTRVYPSGIVSLVSDSYNFWDTLTITLPELKDTIMSRDGRLVIRPDSGNPIDVICGTLTNLESFSLEDCPDEKIMLKYAEEYMHERLTEETPHGEYGGDYTCDVVWNDTIYTLNYDPDWNRYDKKYYYIDNYGDKTPKILKTSPITNEHKGSLQILWDIFGGTINSKGYKVLDPHIGLIYGDSITIDRANEICKRLEAKGFASSNVVFGIGSYSFVGSLTRDTFGMAIKATAITNRNKLVELYKDPVGDSSKKSAKGLMRVDLINNEYVTQDQVSWEAEAGGCLVPIYSDGTILSRERFSTIKARLN